jgi:hypothetical protein
MESLRVVVVAVASSIYTNSMYCNYVLLLLRTRAGNKMKGHHNILFSSADEEVDFFGGVSFPNIRIWFSNV